MSDNLFKQDLQDYFRAFGEDFPRFKRDVEVILRSHDERAHKQALLDALRDPHPQIPTPEDAGTPYLLSDHLGAGYWGLQDDPDYVGLVIVWFTPTPDWVKPYQPEDLRQDENCMYVVALRPRGVRWLIDELEWALEEAEA
jgi:hypothetical protein